MRKVFLFIKQFFNLFVFVILQIVCLVLLVNYNRTYEGLYTSYATEVKGIIDEQYNNVDYYFKLKRANNELQHQNTALMQFYYNQYAGADTAFEIFADSLMRDSAGKYNSIRVLPAKVVGNSIFEENNFIMLHRGGRQGVMRDMAVIGPTGIVGRVVDTSANFCRVMSVLNRNFKVSAMLKKNNYSGIIEWDGKDPETLLLHNIAKTAKPYKGDTVVTSFYSGNFPPNVMVGTVKAVVKYEASSFYTLKITPSTNFFTLQHAYIIDNDNYKELKALEQSAPEHP